MALNGMVARATTAIAMCCFAACNDSKGVAHAPAHEAATEDAGPPAAPVDVSTIATHPLGGLSPAELDAVCAEESRRIDPCLERALTSATSPSDCEAQRADCRRAYGDAGFHPDCSHIMSAPSSCTATVDEYLTCAKDFGAALSCGRAGVIVGPDSCRALSTKCNGLYSAFFIDGVPPPCTPEESAGKPVHTGDDVYGEDPCQPPPARFVVLGDSIAYCSGVDKTQCAPNLISDYLASAVSPPPTFETHAVEGTRVAGLIDQARMVAGGPGHVYVWTYCIGNDLTAGDFDATSLKAGYEDVFDYFADTTRFPDGATFLLNTQYNPYDDCRVTGGAGSTIPSSVDQKIVDVNRAVFLDVAEARPDTVAIDQLPDFLGHGENADFSGCPYCGADNTTWLGFGPHPNAVGQAHIADKWIALLRSMLAEKCN